MRAVSEPKVLGCKTKIVGLNISHCISVRSDSRSESSQCTVGYDKENCATHQEHDSPNHHWPTTKPVMLDDVVGSITFNTASLYIYTIPFLRVVLLLLPHCTCGNFHLLKSRWNWFTNTLISLNLFEQCILNLGLNISEYVDYCFPFLCFL